MKITLKDISKTYDKKVKVLENLNLEIESNSLTTLLGLSGCGKTTLLRIIAGLEAPTSGEIYFDDELIFSSSKKINKSPIERGIGFVFQNFSLWPNMTVIQNVEFGLKSQNPLYKNIFTKKEGKLNILNNYKEYKKEIEDKALEYLKLVKMEEYKDRLIDKLSGGQKQRVAIARGLSINPKVMLFDEPLSALDAILREQMRNEIKELVKKLKMTSIFVTHDQEEALSISDKIILMSEGKIIEQGTPEQIYYHPKAKFTINFIGKSSYIDKNTIIRPESFHFQKHVKDKQITIKLIEQTFKGEDYLNKGLYQNRVIYFNSKDKLEINKTYDIYYSEKDEIRV